VPLKDRDAAAFGAEALPGGLREINAQRHGEPPAPARAAAPGQPTPLVGLIALARHWLRQRRR
jgi:hypothetical protein